MSILHGTNILLGEKRYLGDGVAVLPAVICPFQRMIFVFSYPGMKPKMKVA
jgi:hypothetical protein